MEIVFSTFDLAVSLKINEKGRDEVLTSSSVQNINKIQ